MKRVEEQCTRNRGGKEEISFATVRYSVSETSLLDLAINAPGQFLPLNLVCIEVCCSYLGANFNRLLLQPTHI